MLELAPSLPRATPNLKKEKEIGKRVYRDAGRRESTCACGGEVDAQPFLTFPEQGGPALGQALWSRQIMRLALGISAFEVSPISISRWMISTLFCLAAAWRGVSSH